MNRDEVTLCRSKVHSVIKEYNERTERNLSEELIADAKVSGEQSYDEILGYVERPNNDFDQDGHGILMGFKKLVRLLGLDI
jgi:hypothetical protein